MTTADKKIIKIILSISLSIAGVTAGSSCNKLVEVDSPENKMIGADVFNADGSATSAVMGIYAAMSTTANIVSGATSVYAGLCSDELSYTGTTASVQDFAANTLQSSNGTIESSFWLRAYQYIYQANAGIEGLQQSTTLSASLKTQLLGESIFLRSFVYFYLTNLLGDVPLILGTAYEENGKAARVARDSVMAQVVKDLLQAETLLQADYPSADRVRATKWAAKALLARCYLYQKNWTEAERLATEVIQSGRFALVADAANAFLANNTEAIVQLKAVNVGYNTQEATMFLPSTSATARPNYILSDTLLKAFEANDKRKTAWSASKTVSTVTYNYVNKYKQRLDFSSAYSIKEHYTLLRLAEQYLVRAEARMEQNNLSGAISDLDSVRNRAGLPLIKNTNPGIGKDDLSKAIQHENQVEFFGEWGHRWLDLIRKGEANNKLKYKAGWNATDTLWPIPNAQRLLNPALTQNNGYN